MVAIGAALFEVPAGVRPLAAALVVPVMVLALVFLYFCGKGRFWSYVGAAVLGLFGITLRLVISTQPNLEPPGGVPTGITAVYIVLGALLAVKAYESTFELWNPRPEPASAPD